MSKLERIALFRRITRYIVNFYNYTWLFLEIHMQKIIFISFILLCVNDVSKIILIYIYTRPVLRMINKLIIYHLFIIDMRHKFLLHRRRSYNDQFQKEYTDNDD